MKIALAQIRSEHEHVEENIQHHLTCCQQAAEAGCDLIVFPELSLTGYFPENARAESFSIQDYRLWPFQEIADAHQMYIALGAPVRIREYLGIGMVWVTPGTFPVTYTKQFLHPSEEAFFNPLSTLQSMQLRDVRFAPAICYESTLTSSIERALRVGADIYLVSTAKSAEKLPATLDQLREFASKYSLTTLFVNFVGPSGIFETAGRSSIWDDRGTLLGQLGETEEGLLVYESELGEAVVLNLT